MGNDQMKIFYFSIGTLMTKKVVNENIDTLMNRKFLEFAIQSVKNPRGKRDERR